MSTGAGPTHAGHARRSPSLGELYEAHADFVWRSLRRMGAPEAMLEDLMHDVFVVVQRRLKEYDGRASIKTWLYHLARGVAANEQRRRVREQQRIWRAQPQPTREPDPEATHERKEAAAFVRTFLDALAVEQRNVFVLAEIEGLPVPEVASLLGVNLNTAYGRLRTARRLFRAAVVRHTGVGHAGR